MANTLTVHQATIIAQEAMGQLRKSLVLAKRVNRNFDTEVATQGVAVKVPKFGSLAANAKVSGSDVTVQDVTSTSVTVTLDKHKEATFIIEDIEKATSSNDLLVGYMGSAMIALTEKVEDDLFALYSGLSTEIGTGGNDITAALIRLARKTLTDAKAPRDMRTLVLSTSDASALMAADSQFLLAVQNKGSATVIEEGIIGRYMGFDVIESQAVPVTSTTHSHNLAFHKDAFALVVRPLPAVPTGMGAVSSVVMDPESGLALRAILSYDTGRLGVKCTVDMLYGVAELRDELAVEVLGKF